MGLIGKIFVKLGLDNSEFKKGIDDSEKKSSAFKDTLKGIGQGMLAAFSVGALINFGKKAISEFAAAELAAKKLESVLRATGGAIGLNTEELKAYARERELATAVDGDAIIDAMAQLSSFKSIQKDVFKGAIKSAQDLAAVWGTDLQSQVLALGKALEDPERGIQALRRTGTMFTEEQIANIKRLIDENKKHEAQLIILNEIQGQYGGAAEAAANTAIGSWRKVGIAWDNFMENIGSGITKTTGLANTLIGAIEILDGILNKSFKEGTLGWYLWVGGARQLKRNQEAEAQAQAEETMKGITSITQATLLQNEIRAQGGKALNLYNIALLQLLDTYIKEQKLARQNAQARKAADEASAQAAKDAKAAEEAKEAAERAAEEARKKGQEGTIQRQTYLIQQLQERIKLEQDEGKRAAMNQDLQNLQYQLEVMQMTTKELKEQIALRQRAQTTLQKVSHNIQGKAVVQNQTDPIKSVPTQAEELSDFNDNFEEEVNRSANIAANFGQSVAQSMSDSMRLLMDAIASGEKIDASAMVKAILMPFADMAVKIGEVLVASGAAAIAAKLLIKNPYTAIAAGAALIAIGTAAQAAIGSISSNIGNTGGGGTTTFTGGTGYSSTPALAAINAPPVEVVGVLRGQDIYLSSEKYKQNKGR